MRRLAWTLPFLLPAASAWAQQYDSGDPTPAEQVVLESINRARANPIAEGNRLSAAAVTANPSLVAGLGVPGIPAGSGQAGDITEGLLSPNNIVGARPPLAMNKILLGTARAHNADMYANDIFQHNSSGGIDPGTRMQNAGYTWMSGGASGENIAEAGSSGGGLIANSDQLENILMIDHGLTGRGHRVNLLDTHAAPFFREIGIGSLHHDAPTATLNMTDLLTEDFGRIDANGPFVVGVVYDDLNGNGIYDAGEGMGNVTVRLSPAGGPFAVTGLAGGFAFPANTSGTITVQATGGGFGSVVVTKVIVPPFPGENVKVDFKLSDAGLADSDGDGLPDAWETAFFGNLSQTAGGDFDGDGFTNLQEFLAGSDPTLAGSTPSPPGGGGGGGGTGNSTGGGGGGGGCGLLGLEGVLILTLLRRRRP